MFTKYIFLFLGILVKEMLRLDSNVERMQDKQSGLKGSINLNSIYSNSFPDETSSSVLDLLVSTKSNDFMIGTDPNLKGDSSQIDFLDFPLRKWYCYESDLDDKVRMRGLLNDGHSDDDHLIEIDQKRKQSFVNPYSNVSQVFRNCTNKLNFTLNLAKSMQFVNSIEDLKISNQTIGIIFISTPHHGNQSLPSLYRRMFRWILTPEAMQLENSQFTFGLYNL